MKWYELTVEVIAGDSDEVAAIFHGLDTLGIEIIDVKDYDALKDGWLGNFKTEDVRDKYAATPFVKGYFDIDSSIDELVKTILSKLQVLSTDYNRNQVETSIVEDTDWATQWKEYYRPINITRDIRIIPIWEKETFNQEGKFDIFLDPGVAFGTGSHATTQLSMQLMNTVMRGGETVIDVGTGSGILAILAAKLGAKEVAAYDYDDQATRATVMNVDLNGMAETISIGQNDKLNGIDTQVDLIVANILADILLPLIPQAYQNLKPNGGFILSGIFQKNYPEIMDSLIANDFRIEEILRRGDWYAIYAKKGREDLSKDTL